MDDNLKNKPGLTEVYENDLEDEDNEADTNKYLSFNIEGKLYGLDIKDIKDIIEVQKITEIPDMPYYIKGVINLREQIIPVMDMRLRLNKEFREYDDRTCIINIAIDDITIGLIVDTVSEVLTIPDNKIADPPSFKKESSDNNFVSGIGKLDDDNVVVILSAEKILYGEDKDTIRKMAKAQ